jgi:predicted transcriptional regulator
MLLAPTIDGGTKMKIMSKAHPNNNQMKRYIASLVFQNLIKEKIDTTNQSSLYQTTEKGHKFLEQIYTIFLIHLIYWMGY